MVLVVADEVHIVYRTSSVLANAAVLPALPHPETALVWGPVLYITFSLTLKAQFRLLFFI